MQGFTTMTPAQALNGHCVKNFIEDFTSLLSSCGVVAKVGGSVIVKTKGKAREGRFMGENILSDGIRRPCQGESQAGGSLVWSIGLHLPPSSPLPGTPPPSYMPLGQ